MVINIDMIEKFYKSNSEVEIIPWGELLSQKSFDDVKIYLNAYNNINYEELQSQEELSESIDKMAEEIKIELREGLTKSNQLASLHSVSKEQNEPNIQ